VTLQLAAKATYIMPADMILVDVWLDDTSPGGTFRPELVQSGTVSLYRNPDQQMDQVSFDFRYGNGDGAFHAIFLHPVEVNNLLVVVNVTTFSNGSFLMRVPVSIETVDVNLDQQPGNR